MNKDKAYFKKRDELIIKDYLSGKIMTQDIARKFSVSPRQVQRICRGYGVSRTIDQSNKLMAKYKNYDSLRIPEGLKKKRKTLPKGLRYKLIKEHPWCKVCGANMMKCPLSVDHIDGDATNNEMSNLQVLCLECNYGKKFENQY